MSGYSRALERLHGQIVARLADATAQHFDQQGQARAHGIGQPSDQATNHADQRQP
jgi:hypothetical protein